MSRVLAIGLLFLLAAGLTSVSAYSFGYTQGRERGLLDSVVLTTFSPPLPVETDKQLACLNIAQGSGAQAGVAALAVDRCLEAIGKPPLFRTPKQ